MSIDEDQLQTVRWSKAIHHQKEKKYSGAMFDTEVSFVPYNEPLLTPMPSLHCQTHISETVLGNIQF